jgi:hypothetical protein
VQPRVPSGDLPPEFSGRQIVRVRDTIVCAAELDETVSDAEWRQHPPVGIERDLFENAVAAVNLGEGVTLTCLPTEEADAIMDACEPRGHNFDPVRQFDQRYTFVRERSVEDEAGAGPAQFNEDGKLRDALALSRLIRDNGFSLQYAARVMDRADGEQVIRPLAATNGIAVYRLLPGREWLDGPEAEGLARLLDAKWSAELPGRVKRAMWRAEYASWMHSADIMLLVLISGLEALLKVGYRDLTAQFKNRASALAADLGVDGISKRLCRRMYVGRSDWAHGSHVDLFGREGAPPIADEEERKLRDDIAKLRDLLRAACRQAIEDPEFRAVFTDDAAIETRWPSRRPTIGARLRSVLRRPKR